MSCVTPGTGDGLTDATFASRYSSWLVLDSLWDLLTIVKILIILIMFFNKLVFSGPMRCSGVIFAHLCKASFSVLKRAV